MRSMPSTKGFTRAALLMAVFFIASCGGGGGGGNGGGPNDPNGPTGPTGQPTGTIQGVVQDGLLNDAAVTVYAWNGSKGAALTSGRTDFQGRYSVSLQAASQPVLVEVTGGRYVEEATGAAVSLQDGQSMLAVLNYRSGDTQTATVTYYSTLATGLAERLSRDGAAGNDAVNTANQRIATVLDLPITTLEPTAIAESRDLGTNVTPAIEFGFATAALSSYTEFLGTSLGVKPHETINSIAFIQLAYDDIRADGRLDGRGTTGDLFLGAQRLSTEVYRHELALQIFRTADNPIANATQIKGSALLPLAKRLNDSNEGIFGSDPIVDLVVDAPNIAAVSIADQAVIFGRSQISATVASVIGINRVEAQLVDSNQMVVIGPIAAPDPKKPVVVLDTTKVPDGSYTLVLRATDTAQTSVQKTLAVRVANMQAVIENVTLPPPETPVRGSVSVKATINDPVGVIKVEYLINGTLDQTFSSPPMSYQLDTMNSRFGGDGPKTLTICLTNQNNLTDPTAGRFCRDFKFSIDNTPPVLSIAAPAVGAFVKPGFVVTGTATDDDVNNRGSVKNASVEVQLMDGTTLGAGLPLQIPALQGGDGSKTLVVRATDVAGNIKSETLQISYDALPPDMVMITNPTNGTVVGGMITVTGQASDRNLSTLRIGFVEVATNVQITCSMDVTAIQAQPDGTLLGVIRFQTNTAKSRNGDHRFTLYARDKAGNETASSPVVFRFSNSSPPTTPPTAFGPDCSLAQ